MWARKEPEMLDPPEKTQEDVTSEFCRSCDRSAENSRSESRVAITAQRSRHNSHVSAQTLARVHTWADHVLLCLVRIAVELSCSEVARYYSQQSAISHTQPDFSVNIGFGVHLGWAMRAPVTLGGKVDMSLVSPHVQLSEQMESLTKTYGVPILITTTVYALLSPPLRAICRLVDVVKVADMDQIVGLYALDMCDDDVAALARRYVSYYLSSSIVVCFF